MKPKTLYLLFCLVGVIVPYWQFVPWLFQHGPNLHLFVDEMFANRIGAFFVMDVIVSAIVLLTFTRVESKRMRIANRWMVVVAVLSVGISLGLPLFLFLRELELEKNSIAVSA